MSEKSSLDATIGDFSGEPLRIFRLSRRLRDMFLSGDFGLGCPLLRCAAWAPNSLRTAIATLSVGSAVSVFIGASPLLPGKCILVDPPLTAVFFFNTLTPFFAAVIPPQVSIISFLNIFVEIIIACASSSISKGISP